MAANRIKGITIEIGGDTTKLDQALRGSNKTISDTQKSLKDVEKLLKLDPTNVELLEQKQRLLAQATEATSEKLKTLRTAAEQADEALARGTAYEAKYAPLKQSLDDVGGKLRELKAQQQQVEEAFQAGEISTAEYEKFNAALQSTQTEYSKLKAAKKDLDQEFAGTKLNQEQYDALQRELMETEKAAEDAQAAFKDFNPTLEEFGAKAEAVSQKADGVYNATKGLSAAAAGATTGLLGMAVNAARTADDLNTLAKQSGFSAQTIQEWQYASDRVDVSVDTIVSAAQRMKRNMNSESAEVQAAWQQLGVVVKDSSGNFLSAEDVFNQTLIALSRVPNETERDVLAMTLFGKKADELAGIVDDGGEQLRALGAEAENAGLILSGEALDNANKFNDGLDKLKATATATFLEMGAKLAESLLPALENLMKIIEPILNFIGNLDGKTLKLMVTIGALVAAIAPVAKAISAVTGAVSGVSKVAGLFSAGAGEQTFLTFTKWASVIAIVVMAITTLLGVIAVLTNKSGELNRTMGSLTGAQGSVNQQLQNAQRGKGFVGASMDTMRQVLPKFASGGVFMPNNPVIGILGDNPTEREIAAPESTLRSVMADTLRTQPTGGTINAVMQVDGVTFARLIAPYTDKESTRRGVSLVGM